VNELANVSQYEDPLIEEIERRFLDLMDDRATNSPTFSKTEILRILTAQDSLSLSARGSVPGWAKRVLLETAICMEDGPALSIDACASMDIYFWPPRASPARARGLGRSGRARRGLGGSARAWGCLLGVGFVVFY
jgi:hypothetical protein